MESTEYMQTSKENGSFTCPQPNQTPKKKKNKIENKRRFSDEQIRSLECIFESETKLEPRKKVLLARELGLQPRQIAIWFQNRRARWKSKRLEQEYRNLKDDYDNLASKFESLKKEKESLHIEFQMLNNLMETSHDEDKEIKIEKEKETDGYTNWGSETKQSCSNNELEDRGALDSDVEKRNKDKYFEDKGHQLLRMSEHINGPLAYLEKWYGTVNLGGGFDQSCSNSQWFDFCT